MDEALNVINDWIPEDLRGYESFIQAQALEVFDLADVNGPDERVLQLVTESVCFALRGTIDGYRFLGRSATKDSLIGQAFG